MSRKDMDETTSSSSEQPTNFDISLADTTVNLDQQVVQSSPVSSPTAIQEPSVPIGTQISTSSGTEEIRCSTRPHVSTTRPIQSNST